MTTIRLLYTNLVKGLEIKYQITKKLSIPFMLMRMYLPVSILINVTVLILFFCDFHEKNVITEDLQITKNTKLRRLIIKGLKYKQTQTRH